MTDSSDKQPLHRCVLAEYDDEGINVYQAFSEYTGLNALKHQAFVHGLGFNRKRMTWIKPSLAWALYRSGYATKGRQTVLLKIKVCHEGFLEILRQCVLAEYEETGFHSNKEDWRSLLAVHDGRVQWDPAYDYDIRNKLAHRAIQIGLGGDLPNRYADEWILSIEDATPLAHSLKRAVETGRPLPELPNERHYTVDQDIMDRLNMTPI